MTLNPFDEPVEYKNCSSYSAKISYWKSFLEGGYYHTPPIPAETQKARGIFFIMNKSPVVKAAFGWTVPKHILFNAGDQFSDSSFNYPVFARPCPVDPRHGFVDSTTCKNADEVNALSRATYEEEENAEFLVTKPIDASYGAILTDGTLTFAVGNDGATSGNNVKYFYLSGDPIAPAISLDPTVLLEGEVPFYELVLDKSGHTNLVQVRSAPGVPKCKDYIPNPVTVKKIVKAEGDLLDWEKLMHEVDPATTIVDHTNGSLASHYAIHAIINKVPIFTSYLPDMGAEVPATVFDSEINEEDREKFYKAFCYGFSAGEYMMKNSKFFGNGTGRSVMNAAMTLSLSCLHNFSAIAMAKDYEVVGITLGLFLRATFVVSSGETRHCNRENAKQAELKAWLDAIPGDREGAYNWHYRKPTEQFIREAMTIYRIFNDVNWRGGFGGEKWASCTRSSIDLFNACVKRDINSVVELFNQVLHEEHNGGKYLNKVINVNQFDEAANDPSLYALKNLNVVIDMLATVWDFANNTPDEDIPWDAFVPMDINQKVVNKFQPSGRHKITSAKIVISEGKVKQIKVNGESDAFTGGPKTFNLTTSKHYDTCGEGCCHVEGEFDLVSIPYYWTYNGDKIISKAGLNKLIDGNNVKKKIQKVKKSAGGAVNSTASFPNSNSSPTAQVYDVSGTVSTASSDLIGQLKKKLLEASNKKVKGNVFIQALASTEEEKLFETFKELTSGLEAEIIEFDDSE